MIKLRFWIFALLVVVLVGVNFHFTSRERFRSAESWAGAVLSQAARGLDAAVAVASADKLERVRAAAAAPGVQAAVTGAVTAGTAPDQAGVDALRGAVAGEGAPALVALVTPGGAVGQADPEAPTEPWEEIPTWRPLESALAGHPAVGVVQVPGVGVLQVASAPVVVPRGVAAVLLGWPVDVAHARSMAQSLGVEVAYLGEPGLVAASTPPIRHQTLAEDAGRAGPDTVFGWGRDATLPIVALTQPVTGVPPVAAFGKKLGATGDGAVILSVSARDPMESLERYQLLQLAVAVGLLLLALLWGFYISAAANGPAKRMMRRLQAPAAGDLKVRLEPKQYRGPFAALARTINGVLDQVQRRAPGVAEAVLTRTGEQVSAVLPAPAPEPEEAHPAADFPFGASEPEAPAPPLAEAIPPTAASEAGTGFDPFGAGPEPEPETPWREDTRITSPDELASLREEAAAPPRREATDPFAAAMAEQGPEAPAEPEPEGYNPDATVVAKVPEALLAATARSAAKPAAPAPPPADPDEAHFQEVYRDFVAMRQRLGESAEGLTYDRFVAKLRKNRDAIRDKHGSRTVRFQVYEKSGKAALKATPVR